MIDHIGLAVSDMGRAKAFYLSALRPLGIGVIMEVKSRRRKRAPTPTPASARTARLSSGSAREASPGAARTSPSRRKPAPRSMPSTGRRWPPGVRTMARLARDPITTSIITALSSSTPTATTSKPCATGRSEPRRASWSGNRGPHFADGPEATRRDALVARFPEKFGWIHAFDALESARAALQNASPLAAR